MKRYLIFLTIVLSICTATVYAQKAKNPWAVSVGADLIKLNSENTDDGLNLGAPALSLSYYLGDGISIGAQFAKNTIGEGENEMDYTAIDPVIKYNLLDKDLIPYLFAGVGYTKFSEKNPNGIETENENTGTFFGGLGVNFYINDNFAVNASVSYRSVQDENSYNHLQHIVGLSYNFGDGDADKDGISDSKDKCPNVSGLKEFSGCPDSDGDGIPDNKDTCPEEPGNEVNNGCADTDGDGIIDREDACPENPGPNQYKGCPDSDGDGVPDQTDKCSDKAGVLENSGCPWADRDNDSITDKDDLCPDEPGIRQNNGCPAEPTGLIAFINSVKSNILFKFNSFEISSPGQEALIELKALMERYPKALLVIEGHASSDGASVYNQKLSEKRAAAVKHYLVTLGVSEYRIATIGFGEGRPVDDNGTHKGRIANRRAKINRQPTLKL